MQARSHKKSAFCRDFREFARIFEQSYARIGLKSGLAGLAERELKREAGLREVFRRIEKSAYFAVKCRQEAAKKARFAGICRDFREFARIFEQSYARIGLKSGLAERELKREAGLREVFRRIEKARILQ